PNPADQSSREQRQSCADQIPPYVRAGLKLMFRGHDATSGSVGVKEAPARHQADHEPQRGQLEHLDRDFNSPGKVKARPTKATTDAGGPSPARPPKRLSQIGRTGARIAVTSESLVTRSPRRPEP